MKKTIKLLAVAAVGVAAVVSCAKKGPEEEKIVNQAVLNGGTYKVVETPYYYDYDNGDYDIEIICANDAKDTLYVGVRFNEGKHLGNFYDVTVVDPLIDDRYEYCFWCVLYKYGENAGYWPIEIYGGEDYYIEEGLPIPTSGSFKVSKLENGNYEIYLSNIKQGSNTFDFTYSGPIMKYPELQ
ncbi:MAG: hypothetical protein HUJ98_05685 [Bacteroidaceae bacterium]|nr:hypothetical protein [Bacteroidales bacterium]MCF0185961.1 hypothetical protein [Bacteroidaceae bacterium]